MLRPSLLNAVVINHEKREQVQRVGKEFGEVARLSINIYSHSMSQCLNQSSPWVSHGGFSMPDAEKVGCQLLSLPCP
jgi:hypothetical protein